MIKLIKAENDIRFTSASTRSWNTVENNGTIENQILKKMIPTATVKVVERIEKDKRRSGKQQTGYQFYSQSSNDFKIKDPSSENYFTKNDSTENLFMSKSLTDMKNSLQVVPPKQQQPIIKEKMVTIEEFYRQSPENFATTGRMSRLSHAFEDSSPLNNVFDLDDSSDSSDEESKKPKQHQQQQQQTKQQSPALQQEREKTKIKTASTIKTLTHVHSLPQVNQIENEIERPMNKYNQTSNVSIPRRISNNKVAQMSEMTSQTLDLELNNRLSSAKDKSIILNQTSTHNDNPKLTYLKRYVANGLTGKNGAKFYNGNWNRIPIKPRPINIFPNNDASNSIDNSSTLTIKTVTDNSNFSQPKLPKSMTMLLNGSPQHQQQSITPNTNHQSQQPTAAQTTSTTTVTSNTATFQQSNTLHKELSIIDLHLPTTIKTSNGPNRNHSLSVQQQKLVPYYKRNLLQYLNNNSNSSSKVSSVELNSTSPTTLVVNTPQTNSKTQITSGNNKSVSFNNTITIDNEIVNLTDHATNSTNSNYVTLNNNSQQTLNNNGGTPELNNSRKLSNTLNSAFIYNQLRRRNPSFEVNGKRNHLFSQNDDIQKSITVNNMSNNLLLRRFKLV